MNTLSKQSFYLIILCILFPTITVVAQTAYQPDGLIKKVITGVQIDLATVTIKDNDGNTLDAAIVIPMIQSENYAMETYVDEQDRVREIVVRPNPGGQPVITVRTDDQDPSFNTLKDELEHIRVKDQALRTLLDCILKSFGGETNSEGYKFLVSLQVQEDKKNQEQVIKIIDENGWLGISQVGVFANNALFLVIQHAPVEIQEKYFPLLKQSAEQGESRLADMALMDDRIRMHRKTKQLYGSQTITIEGKHYVWPIEDAQNVDERRKKVQLSSLSNYLNSMGLSYPQDELPAELFGF